MLVCLENTFDMPQSLSFGSFAKQMAKRTVEPLKKPFMQACAKEEKKEKKARHCSFLKNTFDASACSLKMFMFSFFHQQITKRALDPFKSDVQKTLVGARPAAPAAPLKKCLKV
jgi:hypothetical protein